MPLTATTAAVSGVARSATTGSSRAASSCSVSRSMPPAPASRIARQAFIGVVPVTAEDKIDALGSVTGRIGVAVDAALFYAKGGYAWANNKLSAHPARLYRFGQPCPFRIHHRRRHRIHVRAELVRQGRIHVHAPRAAKPIPWLVSPSIPVPPNSAPSRLASTIISDEPSPWLSRTGRRRTTTRQQTEPRFSGAFLFACPRRAAGYASASLPTPSNNAGAGRIASGRPSRSRLHRTRTGRRAGPPASVRPRRPDARNQT